MEYLHLLKQQLQEKGVVISPDTINECINSKLLQDKKPDRYFSLKSTFEVTKFLEIVSNCHDFYIEEIGDISAILNNKPIVFELKSLNMLKSGYFKSTILQHVNRLFYELQKKNGRFYKAILFSSIKNPISTKIIDHRIVSSSLEVSFGILHVPLDLFKYKTTRRIKLRFKDAYGQLQKEHDFKYSVIVLDIRNEGINEYLAYQEVMRLLSMQKYRNLSGVLLFTHRIDPHRTYASLNVILIPNQQSRNNLNYSSFFKSGHIPQIVYQRLSNWFLLSKIPIQKGWNEWLQIEPEYQLIYKDYKFGNLF